MNCNVQAKVVKVIKKDGVPVKIVDGDFSLVQLDLYRDLIAEGVITNIFIVTMKEFFDLFADSEWVERSPVILRDWWRLKNKGQSIYIIEDAKTCAVAPVQTVH